jgi:hypothetical protein
VADPVTLADIRNIPRVASADRLDLHPGDVIVVRLAPGASAAEIAEAAERLGEFLDGTGIKTIVAEDSIEIDAERAPAETDAADAPTPETGKNT